jgi:hypothetical protein
MRDCTRLVSRYWLMLLLLAGGGTVAAQDAAQEPEPLDVPALREPDEVFDEELDEDDEIETDRDSFTPATTVAGRGRLLLESSYSFIENRVGANSHSFPELLTRYGVSETVELRLGGNYEIGGGGSVSGAGSPVEEELFGEGKEEEANILYGLKVALTEQDRWLPQSALIVQANTPTAGPETATQISTGYVFGWTLPNRWVLDSSLRYSADSEEGDHFNLWAPSVVVKVPVGERWKAHVEYFGIFTEQREDERGSQYFSPGIHYLVTRDFEVGIRTGWGLNQDSANFFSNVGAGVRF